MDKLAEMRDYFQDDAFARGQGIEIDEVTPEGAACYVDLDARHKNANNVAQGGLLYTLADFTFAVAANAGGVPTVTLSSNIQFLHPAPDGRVTARAAVKSRSRTISVYEVDLRDEAGRLIATATMTGYSKG